MSNARELLFGGINAAAAVASVLMNAGSGLEVVVLALAVRAVLIILGGVAVTWLGYRLVPDWGMLVSALYWIVMPASFVDHWRRRRDRRAGVGG